MSKKSAISSLFLGAGLLGLIAYHGHTRIQEDWNQQSVEEPSVEEPVAIYPLNGVFTCNYYKSTTHTLEDIVNYEVTPVQGGWNWVFIVEDGTAIFYTQTAGQFCHVMHVGEEE